MRREALDLQAVDGQRGRQLKAVRESREKSNKIVSTLSIPDEALPDLKQIADLEDESFDALLAVVGEVGATLTWSQMQQKVAEKVASSHKSDGTLLLRPTFNLYRWKQKTGSSPQQVADAVIDSSLVSESEDFSDERKEKLRERVALLLNLDKTLGVTAKAIDVMTEHERIFCTARIISDLRPVFAGKEDEASAAVIIHNLQIGFHHCGKHQEFYVALDTADIRKLKDCIARAEQKETALKTILSKSETPYLEV